MPAINLVLASDNVELPIDSLAKKFVYEGTGENKRIKRIYVTFKGILYVKTLNYDGDGDLVSTVTNTNESEWCKVAT